MARGIAPYYEHAGITIYHGDCREILPSLSYDCIVSDPPYGIDYESHHANSIAYGKIVGDAEAFDPQHLLGGRAILWGGNNYANALPLGGWVVWDKRVTPAADAILGSPFELAWASNTKLYKIIRQQHGGAKNADAPRGDVANAPRFHPTQKPVAVMTPCIDWVGSGVVCDPYMGSGSTLIAAKALNRQAVGIEIEERYCEIAAKRLAQEVFDFEGAA